MKSLGLSIIVAFPILTSAAVGGGARGGFGVKDPNSTFGLCTGEGNNTNRKWVKDGLCASIADTIANMKTCTLRVKGRNLTVGKPGEPLIESIRVAAMEPGSSLNNDIGSACSEADDVVTDRAKFQLVFQQLIASTAIHENAWGNPKKCSWMGACGTMQLSLPSIRAYAKCVPGCEQLVRERSVVRNEKANVACGAGIAMFWVAADKTLGYSPTTGLNNNQGMGRYFQPWKKIDESKGKKGTAMRSKVNKYCEARLQKEAPNRNVLAER